MINQYNKWNKLLAGIKADKKFVLPVSNKMITPVIAPTATLAFAIYEFIPLQNRSSLRICIAGAGLFDADNGGNHYRLLPELIGIDDINIDLVGLDVKKDANDHHLKVKSSVGEKN